jgi:hypothetical protein
MVGMPLTKWNQIKEDLINLWPYGYISKYVTAHCLSGNCS